MHGKLRAVTGAAGCLLIGGAANAQWISFTDETGSRLDLATVNDNDDQEKDVAVADFDKDGWDDIIVVRKRPFSNPGPRQDVLLMNENGVLVDRTLEYASGFLSDFTDARDVVAVDVNDDGWDDLFWANTFGQQPTLYMNLGEDGQGNWMGLDNQSFRIEELEDPPNGALLTFCAIWAGDVDMNGTMDIYLCSYSPAGGTTTDRLLINDGSGFFTDETQERMGDRANSAFGTSSEIHDMNMDGFPDVIKTSTLYGVSPWNEQGQFIIWNDGTGHFTDISYQSLSVSSPYMFTVGHLNADEILDVYSVQDGQDRTHLSNGMGGQYQIDYSSNNIGSSPRTTGFGGNVKMADIDGDGDNDVGVSPVDVDIANCDGGGGDFALLRNDGSGGLSDPWGSDQNIHGRPHDFAFIDIDRDGCLDIFQALCTGWRVFMREDCPVSEIAVLDDYTMLFGTHVSGGIPELQDSDDQKFLTRTQFGFSAFEPNLMDVMIGATSPFTTVATLDLTIESSTDTPNTNAKIRLRNWNNNNNVQIGTYSVPLTDAVEFFDNISTPNRFVRNSDGRVEVSIKHVVLAVFTPLGATSRIDHLEIGVTQ